MKFIGSAWQLVGIAGFSVNNSKYQTLAFNPSTNEPYVALFDYNNRVGLLMKFDGSNWNMVGGVFSDYYIYETQLTFDPITSEPYIAYIDAKYYYKITVKKYNGVTWLTIGGEGFDVANTSLNSMDIKFDSANNLSGPKSSSTFNLFSLNYFFLNLLIGLPEK